MGTLPEVYRKNPINPNHIVPIDFDSVQGVPDSHAWTKVESEHELESDHHEQLSVPVIDLKEDDHEAAKLKIAHALETWGTFQITNHGVPAGLTAAVESEVRRLFSLPADQKMKALRAADGFTGYGSSRISQFFDKKMWHEGFTISGSPLDHATQLWPHDHQGFCDVMEGYQKKMKELSETLVLLILESLGISEEEIKDLIWPLEGVSPTLQLNSYPACPDPNRALGLAPHTDTSLLTILRQVAAGGLQVLKPGTGWVMVRPVPGALLVNAGDLLQILSNDRFHSVLHRVVPKEARQRYSVAYFYNPPTNYRLSPLGLSASGQTPHYRSVSVGEYVDVKAKNLGTKALSLISI